MNLIQKQAADFYTESEHSSGYGHYKPFVDEVITALFDYRKVSHKIEFVDTVMNRIKQAYDEHMLVCKTPSTCGMNKFYENSLFFLQEEVEELEQQLSPTELTRIQKQEASVVLDSLIDDLNNLKVGQQVTYEDLMQEFKDLREFLYLDKKNLTQLLLGKITEMTAEGMVSETVSKSLLGIVKELYSSLLN